MMLIRTSFILVLISMTSVHAHQTVENVASSSRPNIVFIMADDMGYNDVGYHNTGRDIYTPNIDRLAREGVKLENYYVLPICTPTRSQFMSGRSQIHTGLQHEIIQRKQPNALPLDSQTMADKMKEAGYSTDMVGKWHLGFYQDQFTPTSRGFDSFYGMYLGSGGYFNHRLRWMWKRGHMFVYTRGPPTGRQHVACSNRQCPVDLHNDTTNQKQADFGQDRVYSTHLFTDEAIRIIDHRSKQENPFFLFLSYQAVHGPLQVPSNYRRIIRSRFGRRVVGKRLKYAAMTLAMDYGIARVVDALKQNGVWNNTVLVFSSDNGGKPSIGGSNEPLRGGKGSYFEGGVRSVGFVNSPLLTETGYVNSELIHVTDWFPTFVSLARGDLEGTRDVTGFDQWDTLSLGLRSPRNEILYNIDPWSISDIQARIRHSFDTRIKGALRKGDYKIVTGLDYSPGASLFDIKNDPLEQNDLVQDMRYRSKVMEMLDSLQAHQETAVPVRFPRNVRVQFPNDVWEPWVA